jgi:hypothetical protein
VKKKFRKMSEDGQNKEGIKISNWNRLKDLNRDAAEKFKTTILPSEQTDTCHYLSIG